jgi:hypothetical protein
VSGIKRAALADLWWELTVLNRRDALKSGSAALYGAGRLGAAEGARLADETLIIALSRAVAERLTPAPAVQAIETRGFARAGDGGDGVYNAATRKPDHDGWFATGDGRYWELQAEAVRPEQFGAVGDQHADCWQAVTSALAYLLKREGGTLWLARSYSVSRTIKVDIGRVVRGLRIVGDGPVFRTGGSGSRLVYTGAAGFLLDIVNPFGVTISDLSLVAEAKGNTAGPVRLFGDQGGDAFVFLERLTAEGFGDGLLADGVPVTMRDVDLNGAGGSYALKLCCSAARPQYRGHRVDNVLLDNVTTQSGVAGGSPTTAGLVIEGAVHSIYVNNSRFLQGLRGWVLQKDERGNEPEFATFNACAAENSAADGALVDGGFNHLFTNCYTTNNRGSGLNFTASFTSRATVTALDARNNGRHGVMLGCVRGQVDLVHPRVGNNSNPDRGTDGVCDNIHIAANVSNCSVVGGRAGGDNDLRNTGSARFGIFVEDGASAHLLIDKVDCAGNRTGALRNGGTGPGHSVTRLDGPVEFQPALQPGNEHVAARMLYQENGREVVVSYDVQLAGSRAPGAPVGLGLPVVPDAGVATAFGVDPGTMAVVHVARVVDGHLELRFAAAGAQPGARHQGRISYNRA